MTIAVIVLALLSGAYLIGGLAYSAYYDIRHQGFNPVPVIVAAAFVLLFLLAR